jgi:hypothetical protein
MDGIEPNLSSNTRPKSHYKGRSTAPKVEKDLSFAINEVRLMLSALAYKLSCVVRSAAEDGLGVRMKIKRGRER